MFGELLGILDEFHSKKISNSILINLFTCYVNTGFQCVSGETKDLDSENSTMSSITTMIPTVSSDHDCPHDLSSLFLYAGFAVYTVTCNLLLLNMIIATFA